MKFVLLNSAVSLKLLLEMTSLGTVEHRGSVGTLYRVGKGRSVREWFEGYLSTGNLGKIAVYKVLAASA